MKRWFGVILLTIVGSALAGCSGNTTAKSLLTNADCALGAPHEDCKPGTPGHQAAMDEMRITQMTSGIDDARCRSYGLQPGSPKYTQCRANLDRTRMPVGQ